MIIALLLPLGADAKQQNPKQDRFTTAILSAPQLRSPANGTLLQNMGAITLSWELPAGATQYQVQATPVNNDGPGVNLIRNAETSYTLQPPVMGIGPYVMLPGMTYTWRLRATDKTTAASETDPSWGPWTDPWSFITPPPSAASIRPSEPPLGVTATSLAPTLVWTDDNPYIFYYEIQVSGDPIFNTDPNTATSFVYWEVVHGGMSWPVRSYAIRASYPLPPGTRIYWRVRPRVQGNGTPVNWGQAFWFVAPGPTPTPTFTATATPSATATPGIPTPTATLTATPTPTPTFTPTQPSGLVTLIVTKVGSGTVTSFPPGISCGVDCSEAFDASKATVVTLIATPDAQWTFNGWAGDADCSDGVVTMSSDRACAAIFTGLGSGPGGVTYTLFVSKTGSGSGTVTSSPPGINCGDDCSEVYTAGTAVQLAGVANSGSAFVGFSGDSDCTDTVVTMNASKTCIATFTALASPTPTAIPTVTVPVTPTASLILSAANGMPGSTIMVGGSGFVTSSSVVITWDGAPVPTTPSVVTVIGGGFGGVSFTVQSGARGGAHMIAAVDAVASIAASQPFNVQYVVLDPPDVVEGHTHVVSGYGFQSGESINLVGSAYPAALARAEADGSFRETITAPPGSGGNQTYRATGAASGRTAVAGIQVIWPGHLDYGKPVRVSSTGEPPGTRITVTASGWGTPQSGSLSWDFYLNKVGEWSVDGNGNLSGSFTIPNAAAGRHLIVLGYGGYPEAAIFQVVTHTYIYVNSP